MTRLINSQIKPLRRQRTISLSRETDIRLSASATFVSLGMLDRVMGQVMFGVFFVALLVQLGLAFFKK
jgi:hypothetical protein